MASTSPGRRITMRQMVFDGVPGRPSASGMLISLDDVTQRQMTARGAFFEAVQRRERQPPSCPAIGASGIVWSFMPNYITETIRIDQLQPGFELAIPTGDDEVGRFVVEVIKHNPGEEPRWTLTSHRPDGKEWTVNFHAGEIATRILGSRG
jgi:hypothetical protein